MVISILCGGSGTRLWPISRASMPKQFAKLLGKDSLFTRTLERNAKLLKDTDSLQVITNDKHYFLTLDEVQEAKITVKTYILEKAIKGDFALVKAQKADKYGNLIFNKTARNFNPLCATAGNVTIAEVEEIVDSLDADSIHLSGIYVDFVYLGKNYEKRIEKIITREE